MRRLITAAALAAACWAPASLAMAGPYADDLAKCVVAKTSDQDKLAFMVWMFQAISVHPAVRSMTSITPAQREASSKAAAELMQRVMTVDCRAETVAALKYEGLAAVQSSFELFGKVAMQGLMSDPEVGKSLGALDHYLDTAKFDALGKEAGKDVSGQPK